MSQFRPSYDQLPTLSSVTGLVLTASDPQP